MQGGGELLVDSGRWRGQSTGGTAAALPAGCVRRLTAYIIISYETCMAGEAGEDATRRTCHAMPGRQASQGSVSHILHKNQQK